jgi:hypothetical protein
MKPEEFAEICEQLWVGSSRDVNPGLVRVVKGLAAIGDAGTPELLNAIRRLINE